MADLRIKIDVDTSGINNLASDIESKLKGIKVPSSLGKDLKEGIESQLRNVDLKLDIASAMSKLNALESQIRDISAERIKIKLEADDDAVKAIRKQQEAVEKSFRNKKKSHHENEVDRYWKDAGKALDDYERTKRKLNEYSARADAGIATDRQLSQIGEYQKRADALKKTVMDIGKTPKDHEFFDANKLREFRSDIAKVNSDLKTEHQLKIDTSQAESAIKTVSKLEKEYARDRSRQQKERQKELNRLDKEYANSRKREVAAEKKRKPDGRNESEVNELIAQEQRLQAEIRETASAAGMSDAFSERAAEHDAATSKMIDNERRLRRAREEDARRAEPDARDVALNNRLNRAADYANSGQMNRRRGLTGGLFEGGIMPTIDVLDVFEHAARGARHVFDEVRGVEDALTSVKKVVDSSEREWGDFTDSMYDSASAAGVFVKDYTSSVAKWAQAGKSLGDAQYLGTMSNIGAFIGEIDEDAIIDYMSVPMNAWKNEGLEAHQVLNVMNEIANNNAVEMDQLGAAYTKAAATAANAGTSFTELTALIGAAQESTRLGGEVVGTSLRQMDVNLSKIANRGTKGFQEKFDRLAEAGVKVTDANGELRSTYDILQDLSSVWGDLDKNAQSQLAFDIAGSRGTAVLTGLMNSWDNVIKMKNEAEGQMSFADGTGSAFDEFAQQQDTITYKMAGLKNAWTEFIHSATGGPDIFKDAIDGATSLVETMDKLTDNTKATGLVKDFGKMFATSLGFNAARLPFDGISERLGRISTEMDVAFGTKMGEGGKRIAKTRDEIGGLSKVMLGASKGLSLFSKGAQAVSIGIGWAGLAVDIFNVADAIGGLMGYDLSGWTNKNLIQPIARSINPSKAAFGDFQQSFKNYEQQYEEFQRATSGVNSIKEIEQELEVSMKVKRKRYEDSGNIADLMITPDEFSQMQERVNSLIEEFDLSADFELNFNNYDHIASQLQRIKSEIQDIQNQELADMIEAEKDVVKEILDSSDKHEKLVQKREAIANAEKGMNDPNGNAFSRGKAAEEYARQVQEYKNMLATPTFSDADQAEMTRAIKTMAENRQKTFDNYMRDGRGLEYIESINPNSANLGEYFDTLKQVAGTRGDIEKLDTAFNNTKDTVQQLKNGTIDFNEANKRFMDDWSDAPNYMNDELKAFMEANKLDGSLSGFFDSETDTWDFKLLDEYINLMGKAKNEHQDMINSMTDGVKELGKEFGFTQEQVDGLISNIEEGDMSGYVRNMLDAADSVGKLEEGLASIGVYGNTFDQLQLLSLDSNLDVKGLAANIQDQVSGMNLETAIEIGIADESGLANFDKILGDITKLQSANKDILINIGVQQEDGTFDIERLYSMIGDLSTSEIEAKLGVTLGDSENVVDNLIEGVENKVIELDANAEGDLVIRNVDTEEEITVEGNLDLNKTSLESYKEDVKQLFKGDTIEAPVKIKASADDVDFSSIKIGDQNFEMDAKVKTMLSPDGEIDDSALMEVITGQLSQQDVEAMVNAKIITNVDEDGISFDDITEYVNSMIASGQVDEAVEFVQRVLPMFEIDKSELQNAADNLNIETEESLEEQEVTQETTVHQEYEEGEQGEVPEPEEPEPIEQDQLVTYNLVGEIGQGVQGVKDLLENNREEINIRADVDLNNADSALAVIEQIRDSANESHNLEIIAEATGFDSVESMITAISSQVEVEKTMKVGTEADTSGIDNLVEKSKQVQDKNAHIGVTTSGQGELEQTTSDLLTVDGMEAVAQVSVDVANIDDSLGGIREKLLSLNMAESIQINIIANTFVADSAITTIQTNLTALTASTNEVVITGNNSDAVAKINQVINMTIPNKVVTVTADIGPAQSAINSITGKTVTVNVKTNRSSVGIGAQIGATMSTSIGGMISSASRAINRSVGVNRSTSSKDEKKVNEEVWRYWSQELYKGNPLTDSMDMLKDEIKGMKEDFDGLISVYNRQIKVMEKQMQHERDMVSLEQSHINDVLKDLRGLGFKTDGNRITNLDFAKSLTGDNATKADDLLKDWRDLYESITSLEARISSLQADIKDTQEDIVKAREDKESKALEKRLVGIEALIKRVETNTSIAAQKSDLMDEYDYNLRLAVDEEAMNTSASAIKTLLEQFNSLAKSTYEFESNAEDAYDTLDDLKDSILDNADAVLEYKENLTQIPVDMLIEDMSRFTDVISNNTDVLSNNIDRIREGLLSGSGISELGDFSFMDLGQNNKVKRSHQERLRLEAELDSVLEKFANQQVHRVEKVANATLGVEQDKYNQLTKMSQDYTDGQVVMAEKINTGLTNVDGFARHISMTDKLMESMTKYQTKYSQTMQAYSAMLARASTETEREIVNREMLLSQLKLQEEYQTEIIAKYKEAIEASKAMLESGELSTSQRNDIMEEILDYQSEMTNAQDAIRDAVKVRFEYEFDMMDKATAKAQEHYDSLAHLLEIGNLTNLSSEAMSPFYRSVYTAALNQYQLAKNQLAELNREQANFQAGSLEWNLIAEKIEEVTQQVRDFSIEALNANKEILENGLASLNKFYDKSLLNGKTLDDWKSFYDNFVDGVEKELKVEELRLKALGLEDNNIKRRLEAIDRQESASRRDLEYIDKQIKLSELQEKLANLERERNVQVLTRRDDGTWAFDYTTDRGEIEKVEKDINSAELELEEFKREQRTAYVAGLGDIIERAREGEYESPEQLQKDLNQLNATYGNVLADIPDLKNLSFDQLVALYSQYMQENGTITKDFVVGGTTSDAAQDIAEKAGLIASIDETKKSLGDLLTGELRNALGLQEGQTIVGSQVVYNIANVELPNVTDGEGFANFFNDLPKVAEQQAAKK